MQIDQLEKIEQRYNLNDSSNPVQVEITIFSSTVAWFGEYSREETIIFLKNGVKIQCIDTNAVASIGVRI